jgi:hypothetical protein
MPRKQLLAASIRPDKSIGHGTVPMAHISLAQRLLDEQPDAPSRRMAAFI